MITYMAAKYNHLQVCLILLNRGVASVDVAVGYDGRTALTAYGSYPNPLLSEESRTSAANSFVWPGLLVPTSTRCNVAETKDGPVAGH